MVALQQRYGRVCAIGVGPLRYLFLFGPDAHRELFAADIDRFSWREVTKSLIPVDGDTAIVVSDGDDHRRRRRVVQPAFSVRRLDGHLPLVAEEVNAIRESEGVGELFGCPVQQREQLIVRQQMPVASQHGDVRPALLGMSRGLR